MREIEFRAWNEKTKTMSPSFTLRDVANRWAEIEDRELMQFTGLRDKEGNKIFEGDIVKLLTIEHEKGGWRSNEKAQGVIEFNDVWGVRFVCKDFTQRTASSHFKIKNLTSREVTNITVIGNIHQNPELLGER